jgi:hypothetical protein
MNDPLKKYRRRLRLWQNSRRLQKENRCYAAEFQRRGLGVPDDTALAAALRKNFPGLQPKDKGNLQIIAVYRHHNWENYSLAPALEKFGPVRHFDWGKPFAASSGDWQNKVKFRMNKALANTLDGWIRESRPDVIFMYVSGETLEPRILDRLREQGIPMVNLALNDKEHFVGKIRGGRAFGTKDIGRFFDLCWTSTEDALMKYCVEEARPIYLPEGANPDIHRPFDLERTIDVSFVGQRYGNRQTVVDELGRRGIRVEAYGFGWPRGPLGVEEMVRMYSRSRINLGFGGIEGHRDTFCLKGRDFEIPMSGGLYLTEHHPELENFFTPDEEILTYRDLDDLEVKIRYYLAHPDRADTVRKKGRARALACHSWEARFDRIFRIVGLLR